MSWFPRNCHGCGRPLAAMSDHPDVKVICMACDPSARLPLEADWTVPTPAAMAAKAFLARVSGPAYRDVIGNRARMGGWVGARDAGMRDTAVSDAIAMAALTAVFSLFAAWAAECGDESVTVVATQMAQVAEDAAADAAGWW